MDLNVKQEVDALDDDLFNAGFAEALGGEVTVPDTSEADAEAERLATEEAEAEAARIAAEEEAAKVTPTEATPVVDIQKLVADAVNAVQVVKPEPVAAAVDTPATQTPEEIAAEAQYRKDWPEHAAREDRLRAQLDEVKGLLATTTTALTEQLAPITNQIAVSAEEKHYNAIYAAHADADKIVPDVQKWIAEQPKFLQPQFNKVLSDGSAAEVVELFDTYKKTIATPDTTKADTLKADTEARLLRMKTPTSVRTSVTAEEDPEDFDSAFEAEAKKLKLAA